MALSSAQKQEIIAKFQKDPNDTGTPEVQIALLTHSIVQLTEHMKKHRKDVHSRRGLSNMVSARRRLLDYLKRVDVNRYKTTIEALNIRR